MTQKRSIHSENITKINQILQLWPPGTLATLGWLEENGVGQRLAYYYAQAGWVEHLAPGIYQKANDKVDWPGGVYALQSHMKLPIHVGGKTALELKGWTHFVPFQSRPSVFLYGEKSQRLRPWFFKMPWTSKIIYKSLNLFLEQNANDTLTTYSYPYFEIKISMPERAILEMLALVPQHQSIEEAMLIMEPMLSLRPQILETLLINCTSIKVKRLFLSIAEHFEHPWLKDIDISKLELGRGKRALIPNGRLNKKYQITLPKKGNSFE